MRKNNFFHLLAIVNGYSHLAKLCKFIVPNMSYDHSEIILVRYFTSRWPYFHELQVRCLAHAYST